MVVSGGPPLVCWTSQRSKPSLLVAGKLLQLPFQEYTVVCGCVGVCVCESLLYFTLVEPLIGWSTTMCKSEKGWRLVNVMVRLRKCVVVASDPFSL